MIEFKEVTKIYSGNKVALDNISFTIEDGSFVCLIGTSGSGKTTTMRMINRMNEPTSGQVLIDGKDVKSFEPVKLRRSIGYVIQQIGLMPHMNIYENIVMVPKLLGWDEDRCREKAEYLIDRVELPRDFLDRYPNELSGGQQQRIGVIRALAADQKIILMDEPFGALDPITRDSLQDLIKELQVETGKTIVFVTHDIDEALSLADKICIMSKGKIVQYDSPREIIAHPKNDFVKNFIGEDRLVNANSEDRAVEELMIKNPATALTGTSISQAIMTMKKKRVDSLFVVDDLGYLKGKVTLEDISQYRAKATSVGDIMNPEVFFVRKGTLLRDAVRLILKRGYKNVPVVDENDKLIGLITRTALVDVLYDNIWDEDEEEKQVLESTIPYEKEE